VYQAPFCVNLRMASTSPLQLPFFLFACGTRSDSFYRPPPIFFFDCIVLCPPVLMGNVRSTFSLLESELESFPTCFPCHPEFPQVRAFPRQETPISRPRRKMTVSAAPPTPPPRFSTPWVFFLCVLCTFFVFFFFRARCWDAPTSLHVL